MFMFFQQQKDEEEIKRLVSNKKYTVSAGKRSIRTSNVHNKFQDQDRNSLSSFGASKGQVS